jgi:hypothetical protein
MSKSWREYWDTYNLPNHESWTRAFDKSVFERVTTYIDASFVMHVNGKGQSACLVRLGNTLVHE